MEVSGTRFWKVTLGNKFVFLVRLPLARGGMFGFTRGKLKVKDIFISFTNFSGVLLTFDRDFRRFSFYNFDNGTEESCKEN